MNIGEELHALNVREQQNVVSLGVGCLAGGIFYSYLQYDGSQSFSTLFCLSVAVICSLISWCFIVYTVWKFTEVKDFYLQDSFVTEEEVRRGLRRRREARQRQQMERIEEDVAGEDEQADHEAVEIASRDSWNTDIGERDTDSRNEALDEIEEQNREEEDEEEEVEDETEAELFEMMDELVTVPIPAETNQTEPTATRTNLPNPTRLLHAEVAIRNGYQVDISTDQEMDASELNALTDIALMRFINAWIGNTEARAALSGEHGGATNAHEIPTLLDHFLAGCREFIEILMAYSVDIPVVGPYILTGYLFILNSIESGLNSFRSDEDEDEDDEDSDEVFETEDTESQTDSIPEFIPSPEDIEVRIVFLDDRRELLKVHPESTLRSLRARLEPDSETSVNLRYVQNGRVLDDSLPIREIGLCDEENSRVLHCIKSSKPAPAVSKKRSSKAKKQTDDLNNNTFSSTTQSPATSPQSSSTSFLTSTQFTAARRFIMSHWPTLKRTLLHAMAKSVYLLQVHREHILIGVIILWTFHMFHIYGYANSYVILAFDTNEPLSMLLNAIAMLSVTILHTMI